MKLWAAGKGIPIYGLTTRAQGSDGQWQDVPDREAAGTGHVVGAGTFWNW